MRWKEISTASKLNHLSGRSPRKEKDLFQRGNTEPRPGNCIRSGKGSRNSMICYGILHFNLRIDLPQSGMTTSNEIVKTGQFQGAIVLNYPLTVKNSPDFAKTGSIFYESVISSVWTVLIQILLPHTRHVTPRGEPEFSNSELNINF